MAQLRIYKKNMNFKQTVTILLLVLTLNLTFSQMAFAQTQDDKDAKREREVQIFVNKLGISQESKVAVKLKDGKTVKGYISRINDDDFVVTAKKTNVQTVLKYNQVNKIGRDKLGTWATIAIAAGGVIGLAIMVGAICMSSGKCQD